MPSDEALFQCNLLKVFDKVFFSQINKLLNKSEANILYQIYLYHILYDFERVCSCDRLYLSIDTWSLPTQAPSKYPTLDHKTSLKLLEYICSNSQKYIVCVKIN